MADWAYKYYKWSYRTLLITGFPGGAILQPENIWFEPRTLSFVLTEKKKQAQNYREYGDGSQFQKTTGLARKRTTGAEVGLVGLVGYFQGGPTENPVISDLWNGAPLSRVK